MITILYQYCHLDQTSWSFLRKKSSSAQQCCLILKHKTAGIVWSGFYRLITKSIGLGSIVKEHIALDQSSWSLKSVCYLIKCIRKIFHKENKRNHTSMTRNCMVFFTPRQLTLSGIYGCQIFDRPC